MIKISSLTYIYFILSLLSDYTIEYLLSLCIIFVHELGHTIVALLFKFDVGYIKVLPFGMFVSIRDFYEHKIYEEICVVLAGPATHIFIYLFISGLNINEYKEYLLIINACVFYFNLIPIYPMDGAKLINLIMQEFIDLKQALFMTLKLSVLSLVIISIYYMSIETLMIMMFLYLQQIYYYKDIYQFLRTYYLKEHVAYKNKIAIHYNDEYRRGYNNYYIVHNNVYDEKSYRENLLKSIKKV